ncbi:MAG: hypothetical protein JW818_00845 [Pirellulales bacterium]|nr:hypothetical protein [Pirellulales bacterium]
MKLKRTWAGFVLLAVGLVVLGGAKKPIKDLPAFAAEIESITVYDLEGLKAAKYAEEDLQKATKATLDPELFRRLAPKAQYRNEWVLWKGSRLAVVRMKDDSERQLALSYYGGFFSILDNDGYFVFEGESRKQWEQAFSKSIVHETFIPKRIERNKNREAAP